MQHYAPVCVVVTYQMLCVTRLDFWFCFFRIGNAFIKSLFDRSSHFTDVIVTTITTIDFLIPLFVKLFEVFRTLNRTLTSKPSSRGQYVCRCKRLELSMSVLRDALKARFQFEIVKESCNLRVWRKAVHMGILYIRLRVRDIGWFHIQIMGLIEKLSILGLLLIHFISLFLGFVFAFVQSFSKDY